MRPLRLTLRGFRSYRDESEFSFEGRSLIGIVGPTGAGKSTILDAIAFALYGRTPSEGQASRRLVHASADSAHVELWFSVGDEILKVARSVRVRGQNVQVLTLHDEVGGDLVRTLETSVAGIHVAVEERLGLDFAAFSRSVLLAQNQFAELLTATPSDAEKVLTGLFGFGVVDAMRTEVIDRLTSARVELLAVERARATLGDAVVELTTAREAADAAAGRNSDLDEVRAPIVDGVRAISELEAERDRLLSTKEDIGSVAAALPAADRLARLIEAASSRAVRLADARTAVAVAEARATKARVALDDAVSRGIPGALTTLRDRIGMLADLRDGSARAAVAVEAAAADAGERESTHTRLVADLAVAEAAEAVARADHESALAAESVTGRRHAAHLLADDLRVGAPCPVCLAEVAVLPRRPPVEDLAAARAVTASARSRLEEATDRAAGARRAVGEAVTGLEVARSRLDSRREAAERASLTVVDAEEKVATAAALLDAGETPAAILASATERWEGIRSEVEGAEVALATTTAELADLSGGEDELAPLVPVVRAALDRLDLADVDPSKPEVMGSAVDAIKQEVRVRLGAVVAGLVDVMARLEAARSGLGLRLASVGVDDVESYEADRAVAVTQVAATAATVAVLAGQVERQKAAVAAAAETAAVASRLERLGRHLSSSGFPQYLLEERRRELADAASERFRQLSADRYGLCLVDDETAERHGLGRNEVNRFAVRDLHVGGRIRSAATLSGGERFLASLALALGLANLVAMDGGRLEAFFVDEGFGSLDADALDLAMEGVERLVADQPDRLVVVVSHVPEMRERILDLIVLDKEPGTGVTRVVRS